MLCREIIAVCSEIHTKHTNALCGQNVELLNVKLAVPLGFKGLNLCYTNHSVNVVEGNNRCSDVHTKHVNTLCGMNMEFPDGKPGGI